MQGGWDRRKSPPIAGGSSSSSPTCSSTDTSVLFILLPTFLGPASLPLSRVSGSRADSAASDPKVGSSLHLLLPKGSEQKESGVHSPELSKWTVVSDAQAICHPSLPLDLHMEAGGRPWHTATFPLCCQRGFLLFQQLVLPPGIRPPAQVRGSQRKSPGAVVCNQ